jgi:peptidoglycan hydrolase-like protein with peptidoglycan-binding domain
VTEATLKLDGGPAHTLRIGHLSPMRDTDDDGVSGVQARLQNLGYYEGEVDGELGPETQDAIRAFQDDHALDATGEISADLLDALENKHGA